ncbi:PREDICTED: similar to proprotein convertase subtilisin/kexin type 9 preproprotein [methanotrophic endosymbiont of Bathymodiolus azoricus (Menez Gwen)]|jgi:serine protease|nr:PREDICTED: similar to proprotein convertase subtilisin/kexin type 9 preproprotein [methanotrophic endosymbiont of Bathymodiolus azoricus (Menez Gwen)]
MKKGIVMKKKCSKILMFILMIVSSIFFPSAYADEDDDKKSYIIIFKQAELVENEAPLQTLIQNGADTSETMSSGTDEAKQDIADELNLDGEVIDIYDGINGILVNIDLTEALRLSALDQVESIEEDSTIPEAAFSTQKNSGWGLGRIHQSTATSDNSYQYEYDGSGRTIYVLDSGLNINNSKVAAEFGGRASVIWDVNFAGKGEDCTGHGSMVSSAAAGKTYGVAKGVTLKMAKISVGCRRSTSIAATVKAINWIAENAPRGSIVNWSYGFKDRGPYIRIPCIRTYSSPALEAAIKKAYNAGMFVVIPAGNDACDTKNYSPTNIPESFVVGATSNLDFANGKDRIASFSRKGTNISGFAPGTNLLLMNKDGHPISKSGTSFSAPYVAGTIAVVCEHEGTRCESGNEDMATLYRVFREAGTLNTVTNTDGTTLTGATSRFIRQQW